MSLRTCRCGAPLITPAPYTQCTHCDRIGAGPCPRDCAHCRRRDEHCLICRKTCGTKTAAQLCETGHRKTEIQQRA